MRLSSGSGEQSVKSLPRSNGNREVTTSQQPTRQACSDQRNGNTKGDAPVYGLEPTVVSYNTAIDSCAKSGNIAAAERYIAKMDEARLDPNVVTFSTVIHACARAGDVQ